MRLFTDVILLFITVYSFIPVISSFSLLERVNRKHMRKNAPDFRISDADVGMRSAHFIGSFRGELIKTRQHHAFIDDNGVPIPLLPYHERLQSSAEAPSTPLHKQNALMREQKILKWAKEAVGTAKKRK